MLELLKDYKGKITVNNIEYESGIAALSSLKDYEGQLIIELNKSLKSTIKGSEPEASESENKPDDVMYIIKVKAYMTKPATPQFDFQSKWNNDIPMPMRIMVGKKIQETKGMVKMELHGEILEEINHTCIKCGRPLTNPISQYFGIGPECGSHGYNNPFESDEELKAAVAKVNQELKDTKWTGWVIKSAIEEETIYKSDDKSI